MKAIVHDAYGPPDVLDFREIEPPRAGDGDVIVRVRAAGVDQGVWHLTTGLPYLVRLAGYGVRAPKQPVRGSDLAGVVEAVGEGVTRFQVGDEVFGTSDGAFAELARASEDSLAIKPASLSFEQAAAVPTSGCTALVGLRDKAELRPGQRALIVGASGGVGTFAVQLAKVLGADVTGVCSTGKVDLVRSIGADRVIDYTREDFARTGDRWDVILDIAGNRQLSHLRRALADEGTLVIVGGEEGGRWIGGTDRQLRALVLSRFVRQSLRSYIATATSEDLRYLAALVDEGRVTPVVDRTYPLDQAPAALADLRQGRVRGKLVLTV